MQRPSTPSRRTSTSDRTGALRVGFVTARSVSIPSSSSIMCDHGLGRLVEALAQRTRTLTVAAAVAPKPHPLHTQTLEVDWADFVPLPPMPSVAGGFHKVLPARRVIAEVERRSQVTIVQLPFAAPLALAVPGGPRVYQICADQKALVRTNTAYTGAKRRVAVGLADGIDLLNHGLVRAPKTRIVTHGRALLERYGAHRGRAVVSTTLLPEEVASVPRSRKDDRFRVLFVGYLRPEKGLDTLIYAFETLLAHVPSAELHIVGAQETVDRGFGAEFRQRFSALQDDGRIVFQGHREFGPDLFECYANADVLAVPSLSEGTPRVLVEARAFGCPVIGSRVGGIPESITDGVDGLLIPPSQPRALADAMIRVATDRTLRTALIDRGYQRARNSTVDLFANAILAEAQKVINGADDPMSIQVATGAVSSAGEL